MQFYKSCLSAYFAVCIIVSVTAVEFTQSLNGYHSPDGFIKFCDQYWDPAKITPKSLQKLYLSVLENNGQVTAYNYYNVKKLIHNPSFDKKKKTFIWVGSYLDFSSLTLGEAMGRQYKTRGYNALFLHFLEGHWRNLLTSSTARILPHIGKYAGHMLANLTAVGLDPKKFHLVGYGTGGQLMSFVAKRYREYTGRNISLLVGLDPAGPCFRTKGPDGRLDPSDADFVLSVATNIDGHGIATPVGHATFYVNGGEYQNFDLWMLPCDLVCSHVRSVVYWTTMLMNPGNRYIGIKCDSIQQAREHKCYERVPLETNTMDLKVDRTKPGIYYVATLHRYPYAVGKDGLRREDNPMYRTHDLINGANVMRVDGL
ncbi:pancreatic lipase-related protein 2-like [Cydia fagiglandana]|uniref:pancreatic lipase-related protein 2-like n=1 Tax=Cydia fagiglandana TaxID=1458189 RepID=UPI002FEDEA49